LFGKVIDGFFGVFADNEDLTEVGFGLSVTFEAVFVAHLAFADLTVPTETLETFGFHLVVEMFEGTGFGARHDGRKERKLYF